MLSISKLKQSKRKQSFSLSNLRNKLAVILIIYFVISIGSELKYKKEIFPFFSWFLFSEVPNIINQYNLIIHEYNGEIVKYPIPFYKTQKPIKNSELVIAKKLISKMGENYIKGNQKEVRKLRLELERRIFKGSVQYELVYESYTPIEKWKNGEVKTKSLVFFKTGELK